MFCTTPHRMFCGYITIRSRRRTASRGAFSSPFLMTIRILIKSSGFHPTSGCMTGRRKYSEVARLMTARICTVSGLSNVKASWRFCMIQYSRDVSCTAFRRWRFSHC